MWLIASLWKKLALDQMRLQKSLGSIVLSSLQAFWEKWKTISKILPMTDLVQLVDVVKENFITVRHDGGSRDRHDGPCKKLEKNKLNIFCH